MKYLLTLLVLPCCGCSPPDPGVSTGTTSYEMGGGEGTLRVKTILIEGNEYLACRVSESNWVLCPKISPRAETQAPARPEAPFKP